MKRLNTSFALSLLWKQNKHHNHGVLVHTLLVMFEILKNKDFKMLAAGALHDIGKPFAVRQDEEDLKSENLSFSFTNHEEFSYQLIKDLPFISDYTKELVRYHYLLRDLELSERRGKVEHLKVLNRKLSKLPKSFIEDLKTFQKYDDAGK